MSPTAEQCVRKGPTLPSEVSDLMTVHACRLQIKLRLNGCKCDYMDKFGSCWI